MKNYYRYIILLSILSWIFTTISFPQFNDKIGQISISLGTAIPSLPENFREYWKSALNIGLGYSDTVGDGNLGHAELGGVIDYNRFTLDKNLYRNNFDAKRFSPNAQATDLSISGGLNEVVTIMAIFKGSFSKFDNNFSPYFIIGIGVLTHTAHELSVSYNDAQINDQGNSVSRLGWEIGGGIDFPITNMLTLFLEGKYTIGTSTETATQLAPFHIGARFQY